MRSLLPHFNYISCPSRRRQGLNYVAVLRHYAFISTPRHPHPVSFHWSSFISYYRKSLTLLRLKVLETWSRINIKRLEVSIFNYYIGSHFHLIYSHSLNYEFVKIHVPHFFLIFSFWNKGSIKVQKKKKKEKGMIIQKRNFRRKKNFLESSLMMIFGLKPIQISLINRKD